MKKALSFKPILCILLTLIAIACTYTAINNKNQNNVVYAAQGECYSQLDSRWSKIVPTNSGYTIGDMGCGIVSLINAINYYNPVGDVAGSIRDIANYAATNYDAACGRNYFGSHGLCSHFYELVEEKWGEYHKITGSGAYLIDDTYDSLAKHVSRDRKVAILNVQKPYPHFVAVVDYNYSTQKFKIYDCGDNPGSILYYTASELLSIRDSKGFTLFTIFTNNTIPETKMNRVLYNGHSGWDTSKAYDPANPNYADRKVALTSLSGDNFLYFNQASAYMEVESTFTITSKVNDDNWGKFGICFFKNNGNDGLWLYVDAYGNTGTNVSNITGTAIKVVKKQNGALLWGDSATHLTLNQNIFKPNAPITFRVVRTGYMFDFYANDIYVGSVNGENYGIGISDVIKPAISSFAIYLEATNYSVSTKFGYITIDGQSTDWSKAGWNTYLYTKDYQRVEDNNDKSKYAFFKHRQTEEGLFIYAEAHHAKNLIGNVSWWLNTNFEFYLDGGVPTYCQYYANIHEVRGFDAFYFETTGSEGAYVTKFEGFIAKKFDRFDKIGYGFKVDNGSDSEKITYYTYDKGTVTSSLWVPFVSHPRKVPVELYISTTPVRVNAVVKPNVSNYPINNTSGITKNGETLKFDTKQNNNYVFNEFEGLKSGTLQATFKLTGKAQAELFGKIGLRFVNKNGNGFFFYADASGEVGTTASSIKGTAFGVLRISNNGDLWEDSLTKAFSSPTINLSTTAFTLKVKRTKNVYVLYVNNTQVYSIEDGTTYGFAETDVYYPSIHSYQISADITNYGLVKSKIDNLVTDSNLSDWKALSTWDSINANKAYMVDDNNPNKGVWFYTRLTSNGLHIAVEANHSINPTNNWNEWWKNTNVEFFIGYSSVLSQFYATEFLQQGFTYYSFVTKYDSSLGLYKTIFEGYIPKATLTYISGYNGKEIRIGMAFKACNESDKVDYLTYKGNSTLYWTANNNDPLRLTNLVLLEHTCTAGTTYYTDETHHWKICTSCGKEVSKVAHTYTTKETKAPTCTATGTNTQM